MFIVGGNNTIAFLNPFDTEKPCMRRLEIREGIRCLTQWRNLVMVGTKCGYILGIDPFSGVHQLKLQLGINAPVEAMVGGEQLLRAVNDRGRLAVWTLKAVEVVRLVEMEFHGVGFPQKDLHSRR